jgi:hypothetical protein
MTDNSQAITDAYNKLADALNELERLGEAPTWMAPSDWPESGQEDVGMFGCSGEVVWVTSDPSRPLVWEATQSPL